MAEKASLVVTKTLSGGYRWTGRSSVNAMDRDGEIVTKAALEADVARTKAGDDTSTFRLAHIPYDLGGAPDFRVVMDGVLVESGEFYDNPVAKGMAEYIMRTPDAPDGSGWGMSVSFNPPRQRVYQTVRISERSALPLSIAANPYTNFSVEEVSAMVLKDYQVALLKDIALDAEALPQAEAIIAAAKTSKALDEVGVPRKSSEEKSATEPQTKPAETEVPKAVADLIATRISEAISKVTSASTQLEKDAAQSMHGPGGLLSSPGTEKGKAKKCPDGSKPDANGDCGPDKEDQTETDEPQKALRVDAPVELPDEVLKAIAVFVNETVETKINELVGAVNKALETLSTVTADVQKRLDGIDAEEAEFEQVYKTPRQSTTYERLKAMSASGADVTKIDKGDALTEPVPEERWSPELAMLVKAGLA